MPHVQRTILAGCVLAACAITVLGGSSPDGRWSQGAALPSPRTEVQVAALGDRMFVLGGYPKVRESRVDVYDAATDRWSQAEVLPGGGNHLAVAAGAGQIYVFGGFRDDNALDEVFAFDAATGHWSRLPRFPLRCGAGAAAALDGRIHVVGGDCLVSDTKDEDVGRHWVFDPVARTYSEAAPIPWPREHFALLPVNGRLYAIGGRQDTKTHETADVEIYDPASDRWSAAAPLPAKRSGSAAASMGGAIIVAGGDNGTEEHQEPSHADVFIYDVGKNSWSVRPPLPYGVHGTGAAVLHGGLYVPAGSKMGGHDFPLRTMLVFRP